MFDYDLLYSEIKRKGFKQNYIADLIGIDPNTLSKKVKGKGKVSKELSATQVALICEALRSPMDSFIKEED